MVETLERSRELQIAAQRSRGSSTHTADRPNRHISLKRPFDTSLFFTKREYRSEGRAGDAQGRGRLRHPASEDSLETSELVTGRRVGWRKGERACSGRAESVFGRAPRPWLVARRNDGSFPNHRKKCLETLKATKPPLVLSQASPTPTWSSPSTRTPRTAANSTSSSASGRFPNSHQLPLSLFLSSLSLSSLLVAVVDGDWKRWKKI